MAAIACAALPLALHSDNTIRGKRLKVAPDAVLQHSSLGEPLDTLREPSAASVSVSGYDKPLRTPRETMLVTNSTGSEIRTLALTVTYLDMQGRQLHRRTDTIPAIIPSGETRMIHLSTWDTQHSYYYHLGRHPRTANVTPYDVRCDVLFVLTHKEQ